MTDPVAGNPSVEPNNPEATPPVVQPAVVQPDPDSLFADQLTAIQTDDGRQKYSDVNTALQSIPHAQNHIGELTNRVKELETELASKQGAEELARQLSAVQSPQTNTEQPSVQGLDETAVADLVSGILESRTQQEIASANAALVVEALATSYGDKAEAEFAAKAQSLNMTVKDFANLARQSPDVVLQLFADRPVRDPQPTHGASVNVEPVKVEQQPDYMARFSGKETGLQAKWAAAKAAVTT
jgi:hypothetical protein